MRHPSLLVGLVAAAAAALVAPQPAFAGENALEVGVHAGAIVFDELDEAQTSWFVTPRFGYWFNPSVGLELDIGLAAGAAEATDHGYFMVAPELVFIGNPIPESPVQPILTTGVGLMNKNFNDAGVRGAEYAASRNEALFHVGTGLIVPIVAGLRFRTDVRMLVTVGQETERFESPFLDYTFTGGLSYNIGLVPDSDNDGVNDNLDLCPEEPEDADGFEDDDGCPDTDNDQDGVLDANDGAPNEAEDVDGFEDTDGVPDPDNDGDGILDAEDACPMDAGEARTDGCPDADGDGIADKDDRCPEVAGVEAFQGCADSDGDGIADPDDECPTEAGPETSFGCPDADGDRVPDYRDDCPEKAAQEGIDPMHSDGCPSRVYVTAGKLVITEKVYFASGKDVIRSRSFGLLNDVADLLNTYTDITSVQIEGHTDSQGDDAMNMDLSERRAAAVRTYLIGKDVDEGRLTSKGFGETVPVDDNGTSVGRSNNRRVEFTILAQEARKVIKDITDVEEGEEFEVIEE